MATDVWVELPKQSGGGGGSPTGPAGGDLAGTYPNPTVPLLHQNTNTFAGFDNTGNLYSTTWGIDSNGQATGNFTGTLPITSITSLQFFPGVSTPLSGGYEGVIVSPTLSSTMAFTSMFNSEADFASGFNNSGGVQIYQDQSNFDAGATTQAYSSYGSFPVINGAVQNFNGFGLGATLNSAAFTGVTGFSSGMTFNSTFSSTGGIISYLEASNIHSGVVANNYQGMQINTVFNAGALIPDANGIAVTQTINSNMANGYNAIQISPSGTGTISSVNGISIQLNNIKDQNPQGVVGLQSDSRLSINSSTVLVPAQGFQIGSRIENLFTVANGSPITGTDSLAINIAGDLEAEDDIALGPFGLGFVSGSSLTDMAVAVGKTVASVTAFLPTITFPDPGFTTGGTITNAHMVRTTAPLPEGGTAIITNLYGFMIDSAFGDFAAAATNAWGLYLDSPGILNKIGGGVINQTHTISTTYTIDSGSIKDNIILADSSGAAFNITLPTPSAGRQVVIKDSTGSAATNNITLVGTIDGATNLVMNVNFESATLVSDGTNWFLI